MTAIPLRRGDLRYLDGLPLAIELAARASGLRPQNLCAPASARRLGRRARDCPTAHAAAPLAGAMTSSTRTKNCCSRAGACSPKGAPTWTQAYWRQPEPRLARAEFAVARAARRTFPTGETRVVLLETMRNTLAQLEHAANASCGRGMRYSCFAERMRRNCTTWTGTVLALFDAARQPAAAWRGPGTGEAGEDFALSRRAIFWDFRGISARGANWGKALRNIRPSRQQSSATRCTAARPGYNQSDYAATQGPFGALAIMRDGDAQRRRTLWGWQRSHRSRDYERHWALSGS